MLKRCLRSKYGMNRDAYRRRRVQPADNPMVAPSYTERRSEFVKKIERDKGIRK
jgi:predicted transcriptional regulator